MRIVIGADFVPTKTNESLFSSGNMEALIGKELYKFIMDSDFRIFNLEMPITDSCDPIPKWGANLFANPQTINGYQGLKTNLLTLANNHILDYGKNGLDSTIRILSERKINYVGVGRNKALASKPFVFSIGNRSFGVYACTEHEFSVATNEEDGANPFDEIDSYEHVKELKEKCDFCIVLYHGGKEYYRFPSPNLKRICRHFISVGADLVICQHSHCIGSIEKINEKTIVYGQGNFLFDDGDNEYVNTGMLVVIEDDLKVSYVPFMKNDNGIVKCDEKLSDDIIMQALSRGLKCSDDKYVNYEYMKLAQEWKDKYLFILSGMHSNIFTKVLNKLTHGKYNSFWLKRVYSSKALLALENIIECESHRELLLEAIKRIKG